MTAPPADLPPASYWPALDGLRGLAILLVFGFHLPFGPFRAGSYGVILFFVLSGFLITTILLRELDRTTRVNLRRFYGRRARRLFPALVVVVVAHLILQLTILGEPEQWWGRSWPVLAYVSNYVQVGGAQLLHMAHTWSLAIEEHFYFLWPALLLVIPRRWRFPATVALVVAFAAWRLKYLATGAPHDRIYFATDTNAFAPLLGCALAIGIHENRIPAPTRNVSALSTAALVLAACIPWHYYDRRLLYGTIPVAVLAMVAIHGALFRPALWLENPVLRWFGKVSYGLYLWHYMMISLPWDRLLPVPSIVPMIAAPIVLAGMSWRFVEAPLLGRRPAVRPSVVVQERVDSPASLPLNPSPATIPVAID
ncbi:MAG: acyltransferase [Acidimicrobiia bacterium]